MHCALDRASDPADDSLNGQLLNGQPCTPRLPRGPTAPAGWRRDAWLDGADLCPAIRPGLVLRESQGRLVIQDPDTGTHHELGPSGAAAFLLSNGTRSLPEIVREVNGRLRPDQLGETPDIPRLLGDLIEQRFLVLRRRQSAA
ncbi:MAG: hypothetical protein HY721_33020 [Planctomycetes bacterium]|nr:hypothetical protein [Planctomycetota bacterium]